jgi:Deoxyribonuclease NucA/NucB
MYFFQYPFASTDEGGTDAQIGCVPWWQNSWQGIYYSSWLSMVRLQPGKQFRVLLAGINCTEVPQSELEPPDLYKRQDTNETVTSGSSVNGELISKGQPAY